MAMFTDIKFDEASGRHEMHFVNQQYDFLMTIYFDPKTNKYIFSCSHEEAKAIAGDSWGGEFDPVKQLREAEQELRERDRKRKG